MKEVDDKAVSILAMSESLSERAKAVLRSSFSIPLFLAEKGQTQKSHLFSDAETDAEEVEAIASLVVDLRSCPIEDGSLLSDLEWSLSYNHMLDLYHLLT
jgi:hypothetical protein